MRQWYLTFHEAILKLGYEINRFNHCVYVWKEDAKITILSLYVDDILLVGNDLKIINKTKSYLGSLFKMKDIDEGSYILGIKISRNQGSRMLYLDQERYLKTILKRFEMEWCKPVTTPTIKGQKLDKSIRP